MQKVLLIVPCYNEKNRLDVAAFKSARPEIEFLFANDGSTDGTREMIDEMCRTNTRFHAYHAPKNSGKAGVIFNAYQEWAKAQSANFQWIGYWDADLATPIDAVFQMLDYLDRYYANENVATIWGSRVLRLGSDIRRQNHRHYLGRAFVTVVSNVLKVKAYDSQCGAKLFRSEVAPIAFAEPFISKWIFDVEILLRLKGHKIVEFPLLKWVDIPGSKIKIFREIFRVWRDIFIIRRRYF